MPSYTESIVNLAEHITWLIKLDYIFRKREGSNNNNIDPWFVTASYAEAEAEAEDVSEAEAKGNFVCKSCATVISRNGAVYFMYDQCFCSNSCRILDIQ